MLDRKIDISDLTTPLMVASGLLWLAVLVLGLTGYWFVGLLVSAFLFHPWFIIGASSRQEIPVKLLVYPLGVWTVLQLGAFGLAEYFSGSYAGGSAGLITGMHPSFAAVYWLYWIGGFMTVALTFGLYYRRYYLPEGRWDEFIEEVEEAKAAQADEGDVVEDAPTPGEAPDGEVTS
ncbi:hypothetical protein ACFR9U_11370 [Halorientalis brevis]|uniref:Uncharacterized protein n=1 Tax=Halorientalis brevis TaxID=1126241 RepID=A0ABD6CCB7_9EURY|nr:hypothetical protein [Halorientalis brevis]